MKEMREILNEINFFGRDKQSPEESPEDLSSVPYQMGDRGVTGEQILAARDVTNSLNDITQKLDKILAIIDREGLEQLDSKKFARWKSQIESLYQEMHMTWFGEPHDYQGPSRRSIGDNDIDDYLNDFFGGRRP